jgi:mannose-6-phosphate isomerase
VTAIDPRTPLVLEPKLATAIWGGDALVRRYGKAGDPAATVGESWECWDDNRVVAGGRAGETLAAARARLGAALMGPVDPAQIFPVLTKIIDARAALSVQVHPDDAYAQRVEGQPFGKTECWLVLDATPGAELVLGWTRDTDRGEVEARVAAGTLADILRRVPVEPGDAFYLPAGTLHAIGAGIQLFEVQQASDLTYRLFDWNRVGSDGKPRALHVAKAVDVLEFRATRPGAVGQLTFAENGSRRTLAIADPRFAVERLAFGPGAATMTTSGRPVAVTAGDAPLRLAAGDGALLQPWQTAVVPAAAERVQLQADAAATALLARVAPDLCALRADAAAAGVTAVAAAAFFAQFGGATTTDRLAARSESPTR